MRMPVTNNVTSLLSLPRTMSSVKKRDVVEASQFPWLSASNLFVIFLLEMTHAYSSQHRNNDAKKEICGFGGFLLEEFASPCKCGR